MVCLFALKHFHPYLYSVPFTIRSDHGSLRWLLNFKNIERQLGKWSECLGSYTFKLIHRAGKVHGNADTLSCRPCTTCKYCDRIEVREFKENLNDCKCSTVNTPVGNTSTWIEGKTSCDIAKAQDEDVNLSVVKEWIQASDQRPRWKEISHLNEKQNIFWSQWDQHVAKSSILYRKWWEPGKKGAIFQLVLPESLKDLVLKQLHFQPTAGHMGI